VAGYSNENEIMAWIKYQYCENNVKVMNSNIMKANGVKSSNNVKIIIIIS
jgi:hypothetical protein